MRAMPGERFTPLDAGLAGLPGSEESESRFEPWLSPLAAVASHPLLVGWTGELAGEAAACRAARLKAISFESCEAAYLTPWSLVKSTETTAHSLPPTTPCHRCGLRQRGSITTGIIRSTPLRLSA
jgi:hypothetical protein